MGPPTSSTTADLAEVLTSSGTADLVRSSDQRDQPAGVGEDVADVPQEP